MLHGSGELAKNMFKEREQEDAGWVCLALCLRLVNQVPLVHLPKIEGVERSLGHFSAAVCYSSWEELGSSPRLPLVSFPLLSWNTWDKQTLYREEVHITQHSRISNALIWGWYPCWQSPKAAFYGRDLCLCMYMSSYKANMIQSWGVYPNDLI